MSRMTSTSAAIGEHTRAPGAASGRGQGADVNDTDDSTQRRHRVVAAERRQRIRELLGRQAIASLSELMQATVASEATVRRDLGLLEREGFLARTRGGARAIRKRTTLEDEFEIRQSRDRREKRLIGQAAAELLSDGMTLFLTDGTTAYALAQCIVHRRLTVITSALNIAQLLAGSATIEVVVIGGRLRATSFGTTGPLAVDAINSLHADMAFIAADGIALSGGVRAISLDDAAVARAMSANASQTVVLASAVKIGVEARARVVDWPEVDELVTTALPTEFTDGLKQRGVHVLLAR
jgi:DeoR/GlpR family transcriptional regulator of sugar metabolism